MEGWTTPTLIYKESEWRIYSDKGAAFVPLLKASNNLLNACPEAREKLRELDKQPF